MWPVRRIAQFVGRTVGAIVLMSATTLLGFMICTLIGMELAERLHGSCLIGNDVDPGCAFGAGLTGMVVGLWFGAPLGFTVGLALLVWVAGTWTVAEPPDRPARAC